jgi:hypothetical protein
MCFRSMQIPVSIRASYNMADIKALVDSGATDNFIHPNFVKRMGLGQKELDKPKNIYNIDDTTNKSGLVIYGPGSEAKSRPKLGVSSRAGPGPSGWPSRAQGPGSGFGMRLPRAQSWAFLFGAVRPRLGARGLPEGSPSRLCQHPSFLTIPAALPHSLRVLILPPLHFDTPSFAF